MTDSESQDFVFEQLELLSSVKNVLRNFKKDSASRKTQSYFQVRLENLSSFRLEFRENHREIMRRVKDQNVTEKYIDAEVNDKFEEIYLETVSTIKDAFITAFPQNKQNTNVDGSTNNANPNLTLTKEVPLPEIKLPIFNGKYTEWPTFKEIFLSRIHNSERLNDFQRFHYLKGALSSEAAQDIQHITLLGENYKDAWKMLQDLYDNDRILFSHYMNVFDQQPVVIKSDPATLRHFIQTSRSCMNSIQKLGVNLNEQNQILVHYMLKKLPSSIHTEWDRAMRKRKTIPKFEELCAVLDEQYQMMITSSISNQPVSSKSQPVSSANRRKTDSSSSLAKRDIQSLHVTKKVFICKVCTKAEHPVRDCPIFIGFSIDQRKESVEKLQLCFNCLGYNHISSKCSSRRTCLKCGGRHHTLIHVESGSESVESVPKTPLSIAVGNHHMAADKSCVQNELGIKQFLEQNSNFEVLLPTAIVTVDPVKGEPLKVRAFLDQGSQASFITEHTVQTLQLPKQRVHVNIKGLAEAKVAEARSFVMITVRSRQDPSIEYRVLAYVVPKVSHMMPAKSLAASTWAHLKGLNLADPYYYEPQHIDILLGSDIYDECILSDVRRGWKGAPIAQQTTFGYIISGKVNNNVFPSITVSSMQNFIEFDTFLRKFWELEEVAEKKLGSSQDQWCEEFYTKTVQRMDDGKYLVRLPLLSEIDSSKVIGTSRQLAKKRFMHLENRLKRDPVLKKHYSDTIEEYLSLGQMKPVTRSEQQSLCVSEENIPFSTCCYLPHHPVVKDSSSTTKIRVVFDASAKTSNGISLNDILAVGPPLQTNLLAVLTNWRNFKFAFTTDIEKMYRRIDVNEEDAQYQRVLWRENPADEIQEYFCSVVMFGTASSPFTAIRTLHQLIEDEGSNYPLAVDVIKYQMYIDDILSGGDSIEDALSRQNHIITMLRSGTFELRKWASNQPTLLKDIPVEHRQMNDLLQLNISDGIKTLGLYWNPNEDTFKYQINFEISSDVPTKRLILSTIARLFDPLGWLNPVIISAKILMQKLWSLKIGWDTPVPENIRSSWKQYVDELPYLQEISVPRWVHMSNTIISSEIHLFCDASMDAYSAAAYLRICDASGIFHSNLLVAKCKVTSIHPKLTIPRAELCGAVLATKILKFMKDHLQQSFSHQNTFFWTDSMIVLGWIRGDPHRWKPFITNRINKILDVSSPDQCSHIVSTDNPVDCSSRGLRPSKLVHNNMWWCGPKWLQQPKSEWPISSAGADFTSAVKEELKSVKVNSLTIETKKEELFLHKFSSLTHLVRVVAYCHRFIFNCRQLKSNRRVDNLCTEELQNGLLGITRNEWCALSTDVQLPDRSPLLPLNPFFDKQLKLIRLGGRLRDSLLSSSEKHPFILPAKGHLTSLIVHHSHLNTLHGGVSLTLNHIRKRFWIINGRNAVRFAIHRCITCYRCKPQPSEQLMGNLPAARIRPTRPFFSTGVDYAGPIDILPSKGRGRTSIKGYIAVFICLVTKAIHLEAVGDLSANSFIGALHRFIGRRGLCKDLFSDCGTNFVGANRKLRADRKAYQNYINSQIAPFLTDHGIQWHFIPPSSPHFGGLWEAGVKSMKYHLKRSMGDQKLTFEELSTVLAQVEACLNSRPLCPLSNDISDLLVLTPGHFLIGDSLLSPPEPELDKLSLQDRWKNCQFLVQQFWRRWSTEYLSRLQKRPKWLKSNVNLQINDIVLIKDERLPCQRWPLGRIIDTHPGSDGNVRVVTLKTLSGVVKRPIVKLCPLPIQDIWSSVEDHRTQ